MIETSELTKLAAVLRGHPDIMIWTDDIYESVIFDGRTIENHLRRIRKRLGVATTAQAIRVAIRTGDIVA